MSPCCDISLTKINEKTTKKQAKIDPEEVRDRSGEIPGKRYDERVKAIAIATRVLHPMWDKVGVPELFIFGYHMVLM